MVTLQPDYRLFFKVKYNVIKSFLVFIKFHSSRCGQQCFSRCSQYCFLFAPDVVHCMPVLLINMHEELCINMKSTASTWRALYQHEEPCINLKRPASTWRACINMKSLASTWRALHQHEESCINMKSPALTWRALHQHEEPCIRWRTLHQHEEPCIKTKNLASTWRALHQDKRVLHQHEHYIKTKSPTWRALHQHEEPCINMRSPASTWRALHQHEEPCINMKSSTSTSRALHASTWRAVQYSEKCFEFRYLNNKHCVDAKFCFLVFADGCMGMMGPHTLECLHNLWIDAGCLDEGQRNPWNMTAFELSYVNNLTTMYVFQTFSTQLLARKIFQVIDLENTLFSIYDVLKVKIS